MSETDPKPLLTIKDTCAFLSVSKRMVYNWINAGKLPSRRTPGGAIRIQPADLLRPDDKAKVAKSA